MDHGRGGAINFWDAPEFPFWQDESYDHWIRSGNEMQRIVGYVEWDPVAAGLVTRAEDWTWSSASEQGSHGDKQATRSPAPPEM